MNCWWMSLRVFFLLSSHLRLSSVSVVFDFNDSLNDAAPVYPMLFSVIVMRNGKSELLIDIIPVFCLLSSPLRSRVVSVVFDFNGLLNDVAPMFPISVSVVKRKEKSSLLMDVFCVSSFFCIHHSD